MFTSLMMFKKSSRARVRITQGHKKTAVKTAVLCFFSEFVFY